MKKVLYTAAAILLCASCIHVNSNYRPGGKNAIKGEGEVISKSFDLKDFDAIQINGHADVVFTQSSTYEVTLMTQENIFDHVDFRVEGNTLILENKGKREVRAEVFDVIIQAPALKSIEVNGASDFEIPAGLRMDEDLEVEVNGAGDLDLKQIVCKDLSVEVNGAADLDLESIEVQTLKVQVNGAGDVRLSGTAGDATLGVAGAGDIDGTRLTVSGEVKKHAAGVARIKL